MNPRLAPTALILLATAAACSPTPASSPTPTETPVTTATVAPTPSPTSASPSPSPSMTLSPSPTSTLSPEQESAQAAAVEYFRALNAVRSDPEADFQQVANATTGDHTAAEANLINDYRSKGITQIGERTYVYKGVGPVVEEDGVKSVEVLVCSDSTNADMVDPSGNSVLDPERSGFVDFRLDVILVGDSWRINGGQSQQVEAC